jgi:methylenetetrahydrofolate dehydrogenase (NADP+)/methenyltetrahydrofolate cyclohydrolase
MISIKEHVATQKERIKNELLTKTNRPKLAIIQVGDNQASNAYVKGKLKDCEEVGLDCVLEKLPEDITQESFEEKINSMSNKCVFN